jgi:thiol:disulfide interchange protein
LRAEGRPIYVDFTARWCATCQTNKKVVFGSNDVKQYFQAHHIVALKGDWTNSDPRITAELRSWSRAAVPFNLVFRVHEEKPRVLPEILTSGIVLAAFK